MLARAYVFLLCLLGQAHGIEIVSQVLTPRSNNNGSITYDMTVSVRCDQFDSPDAPTSFQFTDGENRTRIVNMSCSQPTFIIHRSVIGFVFRDGRTVSSGAKIVQNEPPSQPIANSTEVQVIDARRRLLSAADRATSASRRLQSLATTVAEDAAMSAIESQVSKPNQAVSSVYDKTGNAVDVKYKGNLATDLEINLVCAAIIVGTCTFEIVLDNAAFIDALAASNAKLTASIEAVRNNLTSWIGAVNATAYYTRQELDSLGDFVSRSENLTGQLIALVDLLDVDVQRRVNATHQDIDLAAAGVRLTASQLSAVTAQLSTVSTALIQVILLQYNATSTLIQQADDRRTRLETFKRAVAGSFSARTRQAIDESQRVTERRAILPALWELTRNYSKQGFVGFVDDMGTPPQLISENTRFVSIENMVILLLATTPSPTPGVLGRAYRHELSFQMGASFYLQQAEFGTGPYQFFSVLGFGCVSNATSATDDDGCQVLVRIETTTCILSSSVTPAIWQASTQLNSSICQGTISDTTLIYKDTDAYLQEFLADTLCATASPPVRWSTLDPSLQFAPYDHTYRLIGERLRTISYVWWSGEACTNPDIRTVSDVTDADPSYNAVNGTNVIFAIHSYLFMAMQRLMISSTSLENFLLGYIPSPVSTPELYLQRDPGENQYGRTTFATFVMVSKDVLPLYKYRRLATQAHVTVTDDDGDVITSVTAVSVGWDQLLPPVFFSIGAFSGQADPLDPSTTVAYDADQWQIPITPYVDSRKNTPLYIVAQPTDSVLINGFSLRDFLNTSSFDYDATKANSFAEDFKVTLSDNVLNNAGANASSWQGATRRGCVTTISGENRICTTLDLFDFIGDVPFPGLSSWDSGTQSFSPATVQALPRLYSYDALFSVPAGEFAEIIISTCPDVVGQRALFNAAGFDITLSNANNQQSVTVDVGVVYSPSCPTAPPTQRVLLGPGGTAFDVRIPACGTHSQTAMVSFYTLTTESNSASQPCNGSLLLNLNETLASINNFTALADGRFVRATIVEVVDAALEALTLIMLDEVQNTLNASASLFATDVASGVLYPDSEFNALLQSLSSIASQASDTNAQFQAQRDAVAPNWALGPEDAAFRQAFLDRHNDFMTAADSFDAAVTRFQLLANLTDAAIFQLAVTGNITIGAVEEWSVDNAEWNSLTAAIFEKISGNRPVYAPPGPDTDPFDTVLPYVMLGCALVLSIVACVLIYIFWPWIKAGCKTGQLAVNATELAIRKQK